MTTEQVTTAPSPSIGRQEARELLGSLLRARRFDELAVALQRQGVVAGYGQALGQEAAQIGAVAGVEVDDMVFPSYRQPGVALHRGVTVRDMLSFYSRHDLCPWDWRKVRFAPYTVPVGSQLAHATGWAMADRRRGSDRVTLVYFGDGSASQGEVHEAMNMAGVYSAPVIFLCENNGWAISTPFERQTRAPTLYVRAAGYGIRGDRVDGNDLLAVRDAVRTAAVAARAGLGPTLIEAVTYRRGGHTTSDDPGIYRNGEDAAIWAANDPVERFATRCEDWNLILSEERAEMTATITEDIRAAASAFAHEFGLES